MVGVERTIQQIVKEPTMTQVRDAVETARTFLEDLYGDEIEAVIVEEVEQAPSGDAWLITLGFTRLAAYSVSAGQPSSSSAPRSYKVITVDGNTNEVRSMKSRAFKPDETPDSTGSNER